MTIRNDATEALGTIRKEPFGGAFNSAGASAVDDVVLADGVTAGPKFTRSIQIETPGGNPNGPGQVHSPLWIHALKSDPLNNRLDGEVDGGYIVTYQGRYGDAAGLNIGAY